MTAIPILELAPGTEIKTLFADANKNVVLIGLSDGRILRMDALTVLANFCGERKFFAQIKDGFGNESDITFTDFYYRLKNKIIEINEDKEQVRYHSVSAPSAALVGEEISGIFTTPVLWAGEDFALWKELQWDQVVLEDTGVTVAARVATTSAGILDSPWITFEGESIETAVTKSLDHLNLLGSYIQIRAILSTRSRNVTPELSSLTVSYEGKHALYFFTTKFALDADTDAESGIITGTSTTPRNTEIKFGIVGTNTADWNDYTIVELDKIFDIPADMRNKLKVGIKLASWDDTNTPVVDEFAVLFGGDALNYLNQT